MRNIVLLAILSMALLAGCVETGTSFTLVDKTGMTATKDILVENVDFPLDEVEVNTITQAVLNQNATCTHSSEPEKPCKSLTKTDKGWKVIAGPMGLAESYLDIDEDTQTITVRYGA